MLLYSNANDFGKENSEELSKRAKAYLDKPVAELELSVRSQNTLEAAGITTIKELVMQTESDMLKYRDFGRKSLNELKEILSEMDLGFAMQVDDFGKENSAELSDHAKAYLDKPVAELELSVRSANTLEAAGVTTVGELVMLTESDILRYRDFGRKSLNELKQILSEMDLRFGIKLDE